jgi:hypothetical protein
MTNPAKTARRQGNANRKSAVDDKRATVEKGRFVRRINTYTPRLQQSLRTGLLGPTNHEQAPRGGEQTCTFR